jgi:hypothetical protein
MADGFFWRDWALEVRCIGLERAHESHQALYLFRSGCGYALISCPDATT